MHLQINFGAMSGCVKKPQNPPIKRFC